MLLMVELITRIQKIAKKIKKLKILNFSMNFNRLKEFGYKIEPFNMKTERDYGNIDDEGFYIFKREQNDEIR